MKDIGIVTVSVPDQTHVKALFVANGTFGKEPWELFFEPNSCSFVVKHQHSITFTSMRDVLSLMRSTLGKERIALDLPMSVRNILKGGKG